MIATLEALGEPDDHGERTAMFSYNGSIRPVQVRDEVGEGRLRLSREGRR